VKETETKREKETAGERERENKREIRKREKAGSIIGQRRQNVL
jgi:hypothetical protein